MDSIDRESLVRSGTAGGAAESPMPHPRLWAILGALYIVLGLSEFALAALWRFWVGIAVGLGVAKLGLSLLGLGSTGGRQHRPPAVGIKAKLKAALWSVVMWGANFAQRLLYVFRWLIFGYGFLCLLMLAIHLASPDPDVAAFPAACPRGKRFGCSRVAFAAPHATRHMLPLRLNTTLEEAADAAVRWIEAQPQPRVLLRQPTFLHARFLTVFWGFADDFFVGLSCNDAGQVVLEVQGQLRLGKGDLGVNGRRNQRFLLAMSIAAKEGDIPPGKCST